MELIDVNNVITAVMSAGVIGAISTFGITKAISVHIVYINKRLDDHDEYIKNHLLTKKDCKR